MGVRSGSFAEVAGHLNDPVLRGLAPAEHAPAWSCDGAVAFLRDRAGSCCGGSLVIVGEGRSSADLLAGLVTRLPPGVKVTLPAAAVPFLPTGVRITEGGGWHFRATFQPPPPQPGEERVGWLTDGAVKEIHPLLAAAYPEAWVKPGDPRVRRWAGLWHGGLLACLADISAVPGVGEVAAVAVHPRVRGRGLGAALTAWAVRRLFADGCELVTLGVYAENTAARRLYDRLGFTVDRALVSGTLTIDHR